MTHVQTKITTYPPLPTMDITALEKLILSKVLDYAESETGVELYTDAGPMNPVAVTRITRSSMSRPTVTGTIAKAIIDGSMNASPFAGASLCSSKPTPTRCSSAGLKRRNRQGVPNRPQPPTRPRPRPEWRQRLPGSVLSTRYPRRVTTIRT